MSLRSAIMRMAAQEDLNFLLTNRIPRLALTRFMGWFSKLENPAIAAASIERAQRSSGSRLCT